MVAAITAIASSGSSVSACSTQTSGADTAATPALICAPRPRGAVHHAHAARLRDGDGAVRAAAIHGDDRVGGRVQDGEAAQEPGQRGGLVQHRDHDGDAAHAQQAGEAGEVVRPVQVGQGRQQRVGTALASSRRRVSASTPDVPQPSPRTGTATGAVGRAGSSRRPRRGRAPPGPPQRSRRRRCATRPRSAGRSRPRSPGPGRSAWSIRAPRSPLPCSRIGVRAQPGLERRRRRARHPHLHRQARREQGGQRGLRQAAMQRGGAGGAQGRDQPGLGLARLRIAGEQHQPGRRHAGPLAGQVRRLISVPWQTARRSRSAPSWPWPASPP